MLTTIEFIPSIKAIKYAIAYIISVDTVAIITLPVTAAIMATIQWCGTTYDIIIIQMI